MYCRGTQQAAVKIAARTSAMMIGEDRGRGMERRMMGGGESLRNRINPYDKTEVVKRNEWRIDNVLIEDP